MSEFLISLWESVFTPGPTPTLLRATNATFASLQVLLLVLLITTYSYHFFILSLLSGGLWWAINCLPSDSDLQKRRKSLGDSSGYVSTDSEWEKVSENGGS
ncbi:hypothetical protein DV735_g1709, partial [Chaetothyriales sp. CBS 134920]